MEHTTAVMIPFDEAIERCLRDVSRLAVERVSLERAAGRVLAEDLCAAGPLPAFDYSAMDGYAVHTSTFRGDGPFRLAVQGESRAGGPAGPLAADSACRIFTGAAIPSGANAVIMQEDVSRDESAITVAEAPREAQHIRFAGSDLAAGAPALRAGSRLHPGRLGLLATLDRAHVLVARQPVVTIISTGDELHAPGVAGPAGSIPESNSYVIADIVRRLGGLPRTTPLLADDAEQTEAAIRDGLRGSDMLVTIGGVSVGDHDRVRPAMAAAGVSMDFWGVAIKPGKPIAVGSAGPTKVVCLPGNPASATLTFLLFGVPLLRALQGEQTPLPPQSPLRVIGSHRRRPGRQEYLRARLELHDGEPCAVLPESQSSGAVTSFADADVLVVLAPGREGIENGDLLPGDPPARCVVVARR